MNVITPKGAYEWFYCEGSQLIKDDSEFKQSPEHIACLWVCSEILKSYTSTAAEVKLPLDYLNSLTPNDVLIDDEMYQAVKVYITDILKYCNMTGLSLYMNVNTPLPYLDDIYPGMEGNPDAWVFNKNTNELVIWSMIYTHGYVEVIENPELLCYAAAIIKQLREEDNISDEHIMVTFKLVQPRSYHKNGPVNEWSKRASALRADFNKLKAAANMAMLGTGQCTTGSHCRYCARHKCGTLAKSIYNIVDLVGAPEPMTLSGNNLAVELKLLRRVKKMVGYRLKSIEQQAKPVAIDGKLPGFEIEQGYGNRHWDKTVPHKEIFDFADLLGVDLREKDSIVPPQAAIKKLKEKGKELKSEGYETFLDDYIKRYKTSKRIVEYDAKFLKHVFS